MAASAVPGSQFGGDYEAIVVLLVLPGRRLVAVQAVDALPRVQAHLVFVDHRILRPGMAFDKLSGGVH
jgi:hypothetical protein